MLINRNREKLLNALIFFSENVQYPGKTKLFKLLNYLDFLHFQKTGRSVTGLEYYAWDRGPVPVELYEELKQPKKDFIAHLLKTKRALFNKHTREELKPRKPFNETYFSEFELDLMKQLAKDHFRENSEEISEATHFETGPWHEVHDVWNDVSGHIPYELVLHRRGNEDDAKILALSIERKEIMDNYN